MNELSRTAKIGYAAGSVTAGAIVYLTWTGSGLNPGALIDLCLLAVISWLWWDRVNVHERTDGAIDQADKAVGRIEAVENHLTGLEPPSRGRHAPTPEGSPQV